MKTKFIILFIFFSFYYIKANELKLNNCDALYSIYNIDVKLKNSSGWARVCKNDKLNIYTDVQLSDIVKDKICDCLIKDDTLDRSLESRGKR